MTFRSSALDASPFLFVNFSLKCACGPVCLSDALSWGLFCQNKWKLALEFVCLKKTHLDSCRGRFKHAQGERRSPGMFFNTRSRKKEREECLLRAPDETNRWHKEETNKDEGRNSGLRPQAGQIQDSVAAGSSPRQDNRADGCMKKIRSVKRQFIHECIQRGPVESPALSVPFFIFTARDSHTSPGTSWAGGTPLLIR